ncbi:MAG: hypothetical protein AAGI37_20135 [Planctomycetota bacterium]
MINHGYIGIPFALITVFVAVSGCHSSELQDRSSWPRLSLEAGVLLMDQEMVDAFDLDNSERALQLEDDEPSDWSRTMTDVEMSLLLDGILSNFPTASYRRTQRRLFDGRDELKIVFESKALYYGKPNFAVRREPVEVMFPADLELRVRCDLQHIVETGMVGLGVDAGLLFSEAAYTGHDWVSRPKPTETRQLDVWPARSFGFSGSDRMTWLISLPQSITQQVVSSDRQKATRLFVFIRPVLVRSPDDETRLFPLERLRQ